MHAQKRNILPDHTERFAEVFEHINQLISEDNLLAAVKFLSTLHYADLADFVDNTSHRHYHKLLPLLADNVKPEMLVWLSSANQQPAMEALGIKKSAELIEQLDIEDVIEVIANIDEPEFKESILANLSETKKYQIIEGFNYPPNTVGRVIEKQFITFHKNWTVGQAIDSIKKNYKQKDFYAAIIVDSKYRPVGNILLSTLLKYPKSKLILELMNSEFKVVDTYTEIGEIAFIFKQYALTIVPVVNKSGKLIGSVSIDNMIYIVEQQTEKDIMSLGGVHTQDTFYNFFKTVKHRFPWLFVNLITACITAIIINEFIPTISKVITLAAIMPIVASMGGNAGTQAMTVTVRALANKDISHTNMRKIIIKEIIVCGLNGFLLSCTGVIACFAILGDVQLSIIFGAAVTINFIVAGFFGSAIPITFHHFNIDPATASGVFLTALTDAFGFFTFLSLAYVFLA